MNAVFFGLALLSFLAAAWNGRMAELGQAALDAAGKSVELAIGLVGVMALFLGLVEIAREAGALRFLARAIRPLMVRLFPGVPPDHPAMGAMILNLAANALGLANAATPFGIRAMQELDRLNGEKGTATDAMILFLTINTSALSLLPTGVIALRASLGSSDPAAILPTTLFASACATVTGVAVAKLMERLPAVRRAAPPVLADAGGGELELGELAEKDGLDAAALSGEAGGLLPLLAVVLVLGGLVAVTVLYGERASAWIIPSLIVGFLLLGVLRGVKVYEVFVRGARDGFQVALLIIPYLVAILVVVGMFRASGALDFLVGLLDPLTRPLGLPAEALPMALLRPLSGSGAYGVMAEIMQAHGPDTYIGRLVSTFQGSTETTFYVLAVYYGAVGVHRTRHTLVPALAADAAGIAGAVFICRLLFGS